MQAKLFLGCEDDGFGPENDTSAALQMRSVMPQRQMRPRKSTCNHAMNPNRRAFEAFSCSVRVESRPTVIWDYE
jgi:hypothetical protein